MSIVMRSMPWRALLRCIADFTIFDAALPYLAAIPSHGIRSRRKHFAMRAIHMTTWQSLQVLIRASSRITHVAVTYLCSRCAHVERPMTHPDGPAVIEQSTRSSSLLDSIALVLRQCGVISKFGCERRPMGRPNSSRRGFLTSARYKKCSFETRYESQRGE